MRIGEMLAGLNPFGPILDKELRTTARRKRTYFLRVFYLAALLLCLLFAYAESGGWRDIYGSGVAARQMQQARMAESFFVAFSMFCVIAMGIIAPVLTATAISAERLHRTLHVLLMTPISSGQIIWGKLLSRLWIALTLLALSLPVLAIVRLLGSIELEQLFAVIALSVVMALVMAAIGLLCSSLLDRAYAVILLAYVAGLFLYVFLPFIVMLTLHEVFHVRDMRVWPWITASNPLVSTLAAAMPGRGAPPSNWQWCVGVQLAFAAGLMFLTGWLLRRHARTAGERPAAIDPSQYIPLATPAGAPPLPGASPATTLDYAAVQSAVRQMTRTRDVGDNPVLWREARRPLLARPWQRRTAALTCVGLLLLTYAVFGAGNDLAHRDTQAGFAFVFTGLLTLLIGVLSATAIAQEKEGDTWALLLTTPMTGWQIVRGKLAGVLRRLIWPAVLIVAHFAFFTLAGVIPLRALLPLLWVVFSFNAVWVATGLYLSVRLNRVTTAVIVNLLLPALTYMALPTVFPILQEAFNWHGRWYTRSMGCWPSPYYFVNQLFYGERGVLYWYSNGFYLPGTGNVTRDQFYLALWLVGLTITALAAGIVAWTALRFDRIVARAPHNPPQQGPRGFEVATGDAIRNT